VGCVVGSAAAAAAAAAANLPPLAAAAADAACSCRCSSCCPPSPPPPLAPQPIVLAEPERRGLAARVDEAAVEAPHRDGAKVERHAREPAVVGQRVVTGAVAPKAHAAPPAQLEWVVVGGARRALRPQRVRPPHGGERQPEVELTRLVVVPGGVFAKQEEERVERSRGVSERVSE
jgi:hypothetical protein